MDHLIAKIRSSRGNETAKLKKVLSGCQVYDLNSTLDEILSQFVAYQPEHNLDEGIWFGLRRFSTQPFCMDWLKAPFDSVDCPQLGADESKQIAYLCSVQNNQTFCFQRISKSHFLARRYFLSIGDQYSLQEGKTFLAVNEYPDAIYMKDRDILLFRSLSTISSIFKGIDQLYRMATAAEATSFLQSSFIHLSDGFTAPKISKPNLHKISLAMATLRNLNEAETSKVTGYIQDYCPDLRRQENAFVVATDNDLKFLLYGIEQRYYTTPFTGEKRIASSILYI